MPTIELNPRFLKAVCYSLSKNRKEQRGTVHIPAVNLSQHGIRYQGTTGAILCAFFETRCDLAIDKHIGIPLAALKTVGLDRICRLRSTPKLWLTYEYLSPECILITEHEEFKFTAPDVGAKEIFSVMPKISVNTESVMTMFDGALLGQIQECADFGVHRRHRKSGKACLRIFTGSDEKSGAIVTANNAPYFIAIIQPMLIKGDKHQLKYPHWITVQSPAHAECQRINDVAEALQHTGD